MGIFKGKRGESAGAPADLPELRAPVLARILDLVQRVGAVERPEDVLDAAVEAAVDLTEAERGWILFTSADGFLHAAAARRRGGERIDDPLAKISRTVVEQAFAENRPLCVDEARVDSQLAQAASVAEMKLRAVLCVPFELAGRRGAFYLDNRFASGVFGTEALAMLRAFAGPVAMILRHSDLERQLAETNEALAQANRRLDQELRDRTAEISRLEGLAAGEAERADPFPEILGSHPAQRRALEALATAAEAEFPVLLRGESGTGKDLFARALHRASARREGPFVPVSPAGLSPQLLEAELFGVRKGAYTGADADRPGLFAAARGGSLYLDGLESLLPEVQAKLLRVLEDGSYRPVGGGAEERSDARVIAATREDLARAAAEGRFREDVYYRVRVVEIVLPPLRERRRDVAPLLEHFLAAEEALQGGPLARPSEEQLGWLLAYRWPGNVRELAAFATRWAAFDGQLPAADWQAFRSGSGARASAVATLQEQADAHLLEVLEETGGNKAEAARLLGISRRTLYNRLEALERRSGSA